MNTPGRKLSAKQLQLLLLVFKFRYMTADNLAKLNRTSHNAAYSALNTLTKRDLLQRKYHTSYKLQNKAARYFLSQRAVTYLRDPALKLDKAVLATRRHEAKKSAIFIDHQVAILAAYIDLMKQAPLRLHAIRTASDIPPSERESYLRPLPDLELLQTTDTAGAYTRTLIDISPLNQHLFIAKKRIRQYIEHFDDHEWEWDQYPEVYIVRDSKADVNNLNKYIEEKMEEAYLDKDDFTMMAVQKTEQL